MTYRKLVASTTFWVALTILIFMALKSSPNSQLFPGADKFYHWLGFSILVFTAHIAFPKAPLRSLFIWTLIGAAAIEVLQSMTPGRTASLADMTVNIIGVLTGLTAIHLYGDAVGKPAQWREAPRKRRRRRHRRTTNGVSASGGDAQ